MRILILVAVFLWLNFSCKSFQSANGGTASHISLGAIGTEHSGLFKHEFQSIGTPVLSREVLLSARYRPLTPATPKSKEILPENKKETTEKSETTIASPIDYEMVLAIADRIALQSLLNGEENKATRAYWSKNNDVSIVSEISFYLRAGEMEEIAQSEALFLTLDEHGQLTVIMKNNGQESRLNLPPGTVQDFKTWTACWGMDRYGNIIMEVLNEAGQHCPDGTGKSKDKIPSENPYLKL